MEPSELALKDLLYDIDFAGTERLQLEQFCYLMDCLLSKKSMHEEIQDVSYPLISKNWVYMFQASMIFENCVRLLFTLAA